MTTYTVTIRRLSLIRVTINAPSIAVAKKEIEANIDDYQFEGTIESDTPSIVSVKVMEPKP